MSVDYYDEAVSRNRGLISDTEQARLRTARVAVVGLGGVGGDHLLTLVRAGVGNFVIADLDEFGVVNTNRQVGATSSTAGRQKTEVMAEMARDIHPGVELTVFDNGIQPDNARELLEGVDVIVDSIDFFAMSARELLYKSAKEQGIPVVFSAPIGFSGTLHVFTPDSMSFEDYFDIRDGMSDFEKLAAFAAGLTPKATHLRYMDMSKVDLSSHAGPSIASACKIATGLLTTEVLAILLNKRKPFAAPRYTQFDALRGKYGKGRLWFGNRGPMQRLKRWLIQRRFAEQAAALTSQGSN